KIWPGVVGDRDVRPAVIIEIGHDNTHAFCFGLADTGGIADVAESAVVIVMVELNFLTFVISRMAVRAVAWAMLTAPEIIFGRPFDVVGDHEIEIAILVVVDPRSAG